MTALMDKASDHNGWTSHFWLRHCEGYRVFADGRPIGYVEEILEDEHGELTALVVRVGELFPHLLEIPVEALHGFDPAGERVLIAPLTGARQLRIPAQV